MINVQDGFAEVEIQPWQGYNVEEARGFLTGAGRGVAALAPRLEGKFLSAFVRARKPA